MNITKAEQDEIVWNTISARVRKLVYDSFVEYSMHGMVDYRDIAESSFDGEEFAEKIFEENEDWLTNEADDHIAGAYIGMETMREALVNECQEFIDDCVRLTEEFEAAEEAAEAEAEEDELLGEQFGVYGSEVAPEDNQTAPHEEVEESPGRTQKG